MAQRRSDTTCTIEIDHAFAEQALQALRTSGTAIKDAIYRIRLEHQKWALAREEEGASRSEVEQEFGHG